MDENRHNCVNINECVQDPGICDGPSATCIDLPGKFECVCRDEGYFWVGKNLKKNSQPLPTASTTPANSAKTSTNASK